MGEISAASASASLKTAQAIAGTDAAVISLLRWERPFDVQRPDVFHQNEVRALSEDRASRCAVKGTFDLHVVFHVFQRQGVFLERPCRKDGCRAAVEARRARQEACTRRRGRASASERRPQRGAEEAWRSHEGNCAGAGGR